MSAQNALTKWRLRRKKNLFAKHLGTPVSSVLGLAGLGYLAGNTTHMIYPNHSSRSSGNRHYFYRRNIGWTSAGVSLTRTEPKYDVINGVLTTIPAGQLGANGRIEPQDINRITNSNDKANWTARGTTAINDVATGGPDGLEYMSVAGLGERTTNDLFISASGFGDSGTYLPNFFIRKKSALGATLEIYNPSSYGASNKWVVDYSALPENVWTRITEQSPYVTRTASRLSCEPDGLGGIWLAQPLGATEAMEFDLAFVGASVAAYTTTSIRTHDAIVTRSADALTLTDAGLADVKSMLVILRSPSDGYHCYIRDAGTANYAGFKGGFQAENTAGSFNLGARSNTTFSAFASSFGSNPNVCYQDGTKYSAAQAAVSGLGIFQMGLGATVLGDETPLVLLFDRDLTDSEAAVLSGAAFKSAITAGL